MSTMAPDVARLICGNIDDLRCSLTHLTDVELIGRALREARKLHEGKCKVLLLQGKLNKLNAQSSMPKENTSDKSKGALVVLTDATLVTEKQLLAKFQKATIAALQQIQKEEQLDTRRRVLIGFALHRIKQSVGHGKFLPWLKANVKGRGYAQCNYYMRAATACVEETNLSAPDLLALPAVNLNKLAAPAKPALAPFMSKVDSFCGDLTFAELLDKHGIKETKKLGGARPAGTEPDILVVDPEQLAAQKREELSAWLEQGRQLLLKENVCKAIKPEDTRAFDSGLTTLTSQWRAAIGNILKP